MHRSMQFVAMTVVADKHYILQLPVGRKIPIDSRFYVTHHKIKILDVKWYPGSQADIHIMVLTSDNNLR